MQAQRPAEAVELLQEAIAVIAQKHGPERERRIEFEDALASALAAAGRVDEARALFESVIENRSQVLGSEHPHTTRAVQRLEQLELNPRDAMTDSDRSIVAD